jgi:small GTP-binding protein
MSLFNYATREITLKVVYYGPGLSGKTTNLQHLHNTMSPDKKGKLLSLATEADRTLFFDFMPIALGKIKDFNVRFQLYTVPGQVRYNATRKLVLKGADAVIFVADSQKAMRDQNIESLENMRENLVANNIDPDDIPVVLQYNKRDLKNIHSVDELNKYLNSAGYQTVEAVAIDGTGVDKTFKTITKHLLNHISKKHNIQIAPPDEETELVPRGEPSHEEAVEKEEEKEVSMAPSVKAPEQPTGEETAPPDKEMEKSIVGAAFPEQQEGAEPSSEKQPEEEKADWKILLQVHGNEKSEGPERPETESHTEAEPSSEDEATSEPFGEMEPEWPEQEAKQEEVPSSEDHESYKPFGSEEPSEEEPETHSPFSPESPETWPSIDEISDKEAPPAGEPAMTEPVEEKPQAFTESIETEEAPVKDIGDLGAMPTGGDEASISTQRLEDISEKIAENTQGMINSLSELSLEIKGTDSINELTASLSSINGVLSQILEEFKDLKKHQSEALISIKKAENTLKAIAGAALESKAKKGGGFKLFGK